VAKFTTLVESADLSALSEFGEGGQRSPTLTDFASSKQDLYNAIGDLVIASQAITAVDTHPDDLLGSKSQGRRKRGSEGPAKCIKAGEALKTKVHSICLQVSFMAEEDTMRRRKSNGTTPQSFISTGTPGRYSIPPHCCVAMR